MDQFSRRLLEVLDLLESGCCLEQHQQFVFYTISQLLRVEWQSWWHVGPEGPDISPCAGLWTLMPLGKVIFDMKIFLYLVERRIKRKGKRRTSSVSGLKTGGWGEGENKASHSFWRFFRLLGPNWSVGSERQGKTVICHFWVWNESYISEVWGAVIPKATFTLKHNLIKLQKPSQVSVWYLHFRSNGTKLPNLLWIESAVCHHCLWMRNRAWDKMWSSQVASLHAKFQSRVNVFGLWQLCCAIRAARFWGSVALVGSQYNTNVFFLMIYGPVPVSFLFSGDLSMPSLSDWQVSHWYQEKGDLLAAVPSWAKKTAHSWHWQRKVE